MKNRRIIQIIAGSILGLIMSFPANGQSSDRNYIKTTTYLDAAAASSVKTVQYYDGLGRPVQTVRQNAGPSNNNQDLIAVQDYDAFGRESKAWLPVYRTANTGTYYTGTIATDAKSQYGNDTCANSMPVYEASPLNRVLQQYGPGQAWRTAARPVKTDYLSNTSSDCIYYYMSGDAVAKNGYYAAGALYVTKTTDEDNKESYEFKDKLGRVVLQRQMDGTDKFDTYYVYDDLGNLRWVLPPMFESVTNMVVSCADYGYYYKYDERNRCIEKKLPGALPVLYVYDKADHLIFSQDGEQRPTNNWTFYKYDAFGRMILTGIWENSGKTQTNLNNSYKTTLVKEDYSATGVYNYTWSSLSGVPSTKVLQVNYYDNYKFRTNSSYFNNSNYAHTAPSGYDNKIYGTESDEIKSKGLLTGTINVMLDDPNTRICTVFYYDDRGRVIQSIASNHLGGYEKEYVNYSFTGNPVRKQSIHSASGKSNITETYTYAYDHANRPTTTKYKLDNDAEFTLSTLVYDNKGRVATKQQCGTFVTVANSYNIRNWLTNINVKVPVSTVVFDEKIYYNESYAGNTAQYNGNISAVSWQYLVNSGIQGYRYTYDGLNRLKKGQYLSGTTADDAFTEEVTQYDKNGNIIKMKRYARTSPSNSAGTLVDDLYSYDNKGNQMVSINDAVPAVTSTIGFVKPNVSANTTPIAYNNNGAIKHNFYNGIAGISYNVLNLPEKIRFMNGHGIQYSYDASGMKHKAVYRTVNSNLSIPLGTTAYTPNESDVLTKLSTDYCAGGHIVYENDNLKYVLNPEGYSKKQSNGTYKYYYYAKDHLGNNRATFEATASSFSPQQEISYYPFGMPFTVIYPPRDGFSAELQPYKFGGKEYDQMHGLNWYDFGARYYYGIVPGFMTMDPLAEKYPWISPYVYCANNPVNAIDPTGKSTWVKNREDGTYEVFNGDLNDKDRNIYVYTQDKNGDYTVRGESIGITNSTTSFYDSDANKGKGAWATGSIINPNDKSGDNFLGNIFGSNPPMFNDYMANAGNGGKYDFKVTNGTDQAIAGIDMYRGMPIGKTGNGQIIYSSARDVGNIAAGYVAGSNGMPWDATRIAFDSYQSKVSGTPTIEGISTRNAEFYGWRIGNNINQFQKANNFGNSISEGLKKLWNWLIK